jgi:hypothetical protein
MATKKTVKKSSKVRIKGLVVAPGNNVFLRTVTYHYIGRVIGAKDGWLMLEGASWVADSGRFSVALKDGFSAISENEKYPGAGRTDIRIDTIVEAVPWDHELPTATK